MATDDQMKAVRRLSRAGQRILRARGGFHTKKGYKRPQQRRWADE